MSVVRLELIVPDGIAYETGNKLSAIYGPGSWPHGCTGVMVQVLPDAEVSLERIVSQPALAAWREGAR